ncbi:DUF3467 domain-containing protein [candidate division WOR-3 bacterium]|nr:DUF3467 domain-containing protein [candidate division WOR-3 bacterium]
MNQGDKPVRRLDVEIKPDEAEGIYSNLVLVAHSSSEFIIDFARMLPGLPKARVFSRIIMSPQHTELLRRTLEENIKKYETRYGKIEVKDKPGEQKEMGFAPPEHA